MPAVAPLARLLRTRRWTEDATLVQEGAGTRNEFGEFVPGATTETAVKVRSGPVGGDGGVTRWQIPEGERIQDYRSFLMIGRSVAPIRVGTGQTDGDVLVYQGIRYRIADAQPWPEQDLTVVLAKSEEGQDG